MGYTTKFEGAWSITPPLNEEQVACLKVFADDVDHEVGPGGYCQWVPSEDGTCLQWDRNEKFYDYVDWLQYLIATYFTKWGCVLNGEVTWVGEDSSDVGKIAITDNIVTVHEGRITYD